jgi:hypothetical protein
MAYSTAISGFTFNGVALVACGNASVSFNRTPIDVTSIGMRNAYSISGVAHATIEADFYYSKGDHSAVTTQLLSNGADVEVYVIFESTDYFGGTGRCASFEWHAPVGDVVRAKASFVLSGQLDLNGTASTPGPIEVTPE